MAQIKMKYGIDLGTTNSAIARMENGEPVVKKTDTQKEILPSCISFTKKRVVKVGETAYNDLRSDKAKATKTWTKGKENVFIEFKRTMGNTTPWESSNMGKSYNSEELSAEVLKTLKSLVIDDFIDSAVITIPMKFKADQISATIRAAKLAGIENCELLQEPIAAAMAYGLSSKNKNGYWLVFDFGGGTFDAALLKVEDGIMQVVDTEGDNYLGGKDLDMAIVDQILIPYLQANYCIDDILADTDKKKILREAIKFYAEQAKITLSFKDKADVTSQLDEFGEDDNGDPLELDLVIEYSQLEKAVIPTYQKAIDITKQLLERNNLIGKLTSLILVGGPTYNPTVRRMLKEQVTPNVDTSIDPMTAVAKGAALKASTVNYESTEQIQTGTIALDVQYESNSVELMEFVSVKLLKDECQGAIPSKLFVEISSSDKGWSSGKVAIDEVGDVFECQLKEGKPNAFSILAYDDKGNELPCYPSEITIIQGFKPGSAVLPYHYGIEVTDSETGKDVFKPLFGLEMNKQLPAEGRREGLKVQSQLRPGVETDKIVIPIYEDGYNSDGKSAVYCDHVFDIVITGDDVSGLVKENSLINFSLKIDANQKCTCVVTFCDINETYTETYDIKARDTIDGYTLKRQLDDAKRKLRSLKSSSAIPKAELIEVEKKINDVDSNFEGKKSSDDGKMSLLQDLRLGFQKMEQVEKSHEWEALESELREEFDRLETANNELGNKYDEQVGDLRRHTDSAIRSKDVKLVRAVLQDVNSLYFAVTLIYQMVGLIRSFNDDFESENWKDRSRARQLLNKGIQLINDGEATVDNLRPICKQLLELTERPENHKLKL